jgi:hypothetical protein
MAKGSKKAKAGRKERQERRFVPRPTSSANLVKALGGLAAAALGAGVWAQFGHGWMDSPLPPYGFAPVLLAGGAVAFGGAVWLGTSGEQPLRVGSGGIAIDWGKEMKRVPWHGVERIVWDPDRQVLSVHGKDESGSDQRLALTPKTHPLAIAWIVKEGRDRIPDSVDVPEEALGIPAARATDGEMLVMDAVQVVGKRCASSDRIIAYEPDARVCPRCERVYYRESVPETCACGASLAGLRVPAEEPA